MKKTLGIAAVLLGLVAFDTRGAAQQTPDWGSGVAPFAFALIGDMPYGSIREAPFARLVAEINLDNDVDFVMHAGDIKAGSDRCDDSLIQHRFDLYQNFQRAFVFTPGDNKWTDVMFATVHVVGSNNDLEPWVGITPADSYGAPRADRIAEFERRQAATLAWLDEVFAAAADTKGLFLLILANP